MAEANFHNSLHIPTYLMFLSILPWLIVALFADALESTSFDKEQTYTRRYLRHYYRIYLCSLNAGTPSHCKTCKKKKRTVVGPLNWLQSISIMVGCCVWGGYLRRCATPLCAYRASHLSSSPANVGRFDTDSFKVGIDNHASRCMANRMS